MPLRFEPGWVAYDPVRDVLSFRAQDGDKAVPCAVTREVLLQLNRWPSATTRQLKTLFRHHDVMIQKLASAKYAAGEVEPAGYVLVNSTAFDQPPRTSNLL